jgi:hypothetical protein
VRQDVADLYDVLSRVGLRLGVGRVLRILTRTAIPAFAGVLLWALLGTVLPVPRPPRPLLWGLGAGLAGAFPLLLLWFRPPARIAARVIDRRLGLADRLSTAVELLDRSVPLSGLERLQVAQAVEVSRGVLPREAAPVRVPRDLWGAAAIVGGALLSAHFLYGWALPGTPAARSVAVIHEEGHVLVEIGRQLGALGRAHALPEARRAASRILELGRRLEGPRLDRMAALGLLRDESRQLQDAQEMTERALIGVAPARRVGSGSDERLRGPAPRPGVDQVHRAVHDLESLAAQVHSREALARNPGLLQRIRLLSESLDQMSAPQSSRETVARARREMERGHLPEAAAALRDALQQMQRLERMMDDAQALSDAREQVRRSTERITTGSARDTAQQVRRQSSSDSPTSTSPGSAPVEKGASEGPPPPSGPNEGSLPGQGQGRILGTLTTRPGAVRVPQRVEGQESDGGSVVTELTAPGQGGTPRLAGVRPPRDVMHEIDRTPSRDFVPRDYLTIIRKYFEALGSVP